MSPHANFWAAIASPISENQTFTDWYRAHLPVIRPLCEALFASGPSTLTWPERTRQTSALLHSEKQYRYVRQTGGFHMFARLDLSTASAEEDRLYIDFIEWPNPHTDQMLPLNHNQDWLVIFPALLKGLWEGLQKHQLPKGKWVINKVVMHPLESRPIDFYLCGRNVMQELSEHQATLNAKRSS